MLEWYLYIGLMEAQLILLSGIWIFLLKVYLPPPKNGIFNRSLVKKYVIFITKTLKLRNIEAILELEWFWKKLEQYCKNWLSYWENSSFYLKSVDITSKNCGGAGSALDTAASHCIIIMCAVRNWICKFSLVGESFLQRVGILQLRYAQAWASYIDE